ncbi:Tripartite motif-containing protein 45 [Geodia barretti]|uniref:Tripartite motif-containing protein 45 n=1 Tax=Geodia barretti TaxID=519541 RepID=A0AA35SQZ1_GEOBA|nr:Tripartite motif-containing protein 45 [Geodia barretti]
MAEGPDPRDKPLEELEREITCAVCHGVYQQAKLLPCNHYYCSTCIEKMAAASRGRPLHCPECRKETSLPPGGVAALEPAFFVERMKDVYGKMAKAEGKVEAFCEQCSAAKSVAFCRQCTEFICGDCARSHQKMKVFAGHVVASLEDLKKGGAKSIPLKEAPPVACADHGEPKKLFCFDCDRLICRDCTIIDHRDHKFEFLTKCAPESRKTLRHSLAPLQKVVADMEGAEKTLVSEETKVERQKEEVCRSIQQSFDQLKAVLDQRKAELVKKAGSLAQEKKEALAAQKRVLQVAQKEVQLLVEFVERNVEGTSDQDIMSIRTQLATKMEEEEKRHRQLSLEPSATADIACNLPSPHVIPDDLGSVFVQPTPALVQNPGTFELGSQVEVKIFAHTASLGKTSLPV